MISSSILIIFPIILAAIVLLFDHSKAKRIAFLGSLIQLAISIFFCCNFNPHGGVQFETSLPWLPEFGIGFHIGMDGISMLMVILCNLLIPFIILAGFNEDKIRSSSLYALMLFMQASMIGVFIAQDAFLYYVFWEMSLIPIYFILLRWAEKDSTKTTVKFFIYTLAGSLFMLLGFIYLYQQTPEKSFDISAFYNLSLGREAQNIIFALLFIAYAIKIPVFPFHTWQADTYTKAPVQGTMLLSGIMLKMGIYSIVRWLLPIVPQGAIDHRDMILVLCAVSIVYGSWIAVSRKDIKTLFAYSSLAHVGLITAGIFTFTPAGLQGGMIQMLSHGVNVVGLFAVAGIIARRTSTRQIDALGGIRLTAPKLATCFMIILLGSVALPLTNGFIGEFLLLKGVFQYYPLLGGVAGLTIILSAVYMLRSYQQSMLGELNPVTESFTDLSSSEKLLLYPLVILVILGGLFPQPILDMTAPSVDHIIQIMGSKIRTI